MKATLTKETLNKLINISNMTKFCNLERIIRLSCFSDTLKFGTTLVDIPEQFSLPITNLTQFIGMCESIMGKDDTVDIEYEFEEREHGLDVKKLYTTTISNKDQSFKFYSAETEEFKTIINPDKTDKSTNIKMPNSYMQFTITPAHIKIIDSNVKILSADTIQFKPMEKTNNIKIKIFDSKFPNPPYFDIKITNCESNEPCDFMLSSAMFKYIDYSLKYKTIINCEKMAILFANEETNTFYITSAKKTSKFE